jgi:hypothetical protein
LSFVPILPHRTSVFARFAITHPSGVICSFFPSPTIIFSSLFILRHWRLSSSRRVSSFVLFLEVGEVVSLTFVIL